VIVAVAGIAATAVVGLAGTGVAWISARDDRAAQRSLARDERTYDQRVSAYLDAIDFVEGQKTSFDNLARRMPFERGPFVTVPYRADPPSRLTSRLRAFGSPQALAAFQKAETLIDLVPLVTGEDPTAVRHPGVIGINPRDKFPRRAVARFEAQVLRFEGIVHREVG
jgi:hypothetical protein